MSENFTRWERLLVISCTYAVETLIDKSNPQWEKNKVALHINQTQSPKQHTSWACTNAWDIVKKIIQLGRSFCVLLLLPFKNYVTESTKAQIFRCLIESTEDQFQWYLLAKFYFSKLPNLLKIDKFDILLNLNSLSAVLTFHAVHDVAHVRIATAMFSNGSKNCQLRFLWAR